MSVLFRAFNTLRKTIPIYESPAYPILSAITTNFIATAKSKLKEKFIHFIPFYLESKFSTISKHFIVKMDLAPEEENIEFITLQLGGLHKLIVNVDEVVPVTAEEYELAHFLGKMIQPPSFIDLEMVFVNKKVMEFLVFDRDGAWHEEGVNHPLLSMKERYNEHKWMDFTAIPKANINGGNDKLLP